MSGEETKKGEQPVRRPYKSPQLKHLGSVRELTLGMTGPTSEGGGTFFTVVGPPPK